MRNSFDAQLDLLNDSLISMGATCESAIACAVEALSSSDRKIAASAMEMERETDHKEREIEALCMKLLISQQPVAGDLRLISAALKMVTDMERIGDQASDISELISHGDLSGSGRDKNIRQMSQAVIGMTNESVDAFVKRDIAMANKVIGDDDLVDSLFISIKSDLEGSITRGDRQASTVLDSLMVAKYLERIGDHAVNIAEWVIYSITGQRPGE